MDTEHLSHPPAATAGALVHLPRALEVLTTRLRAAVAERRGASPGSDRYRRADEEVASLNELYVRLQRRMEIPPEIWLSGGRAPGRSRCAPRHPRR